MSSSVFLTRVGLLCTPCVHSVTVGYYVGASGLPEAMPSASLVTNWRVLVPGSPRRLRPGRGLARLVVLCLCLGFQALAPRPWPCRSVAPCLCLVSQALALRPAPLPLWLFHEARATPHMSHVLALVFGAPLLLWVPPTQPRGFVCTHVFCCVLPAQESQIGLSLIFFSRFAPIPAWRPGFPGLLRPWLVVFLTTRSFATFSCGLNVTDVSGWAAKAQLRGMRGITI